MRHRAILFALFGLLLLSLAGCIVAPATAQSQAVPPPDYTPSGIAAQKVIADANLSDAQKQAALVQAAIAEATAIAQATRDSYALSATATRDALDAAIAQHAATATAQSIDADAKATANAINAEATQVAAAGVVHATQTAIAVNAMASATAQTAHERAIAFDLSAKQNQADQDRASLSAEIMAWIFRIGALALVGLILFLVLKIVQAKSDQSRMVQTDYGIFLITRQPDGRLAMQPLLQFGSGSPVETEPTQPIIDQVMTVRDRTGKYELDKGSDEYWRKERNARENAAELLLKAIDMKGQSSNEIPGYRAMQMSPDSWSRAKQAIEDYLESQRGAGGGTRIISTDYPSLAALYSALKRRQIAVKVGDGSDNPTPLAI